MNAKKCEMCGKEFRPNSSNQKFCSAPCRTEYNNAKGMNTSACKYIESEASRRKKQGRNGKRLDEIAAEARRCGLSYGMYVAQLYKQTHGVQEAQMKDIVKLDSTPVKPCPYCMSAAKLWQAYDGTWLVQCDGCGAKTYFCNTAKEAIEIWDFNRTNGTNGL